MKIMKKQQGMTFFGLVLVLGLIAFFALVTLKVVPLYIEYSSVAGALDGLIGVPNIGKQGKKAMINRIDGQFYIDDVETIAGKDLIFTKEKTVWKVTADYEARTKLFSNISIVAHFKKTVDVPRK